ncbi:MAG TPA: hypothetical protein DCZ03_06225, partial [Gammaproteobacteria bacterium]|nr:hypothetical protein [Gammaproteobacteria bacterium]
MRPLNFSLQYAAYLPGSLNKLKIEKEESALLNGRKTLKTLLIDPSFAEVKKINISLNSHLPVDFHIIHTTNLPEHRYSERNRSVDLFLVDFDLLQQDARWWLCFRQELGHTPIIALADSNDPSIQDDLYQHPNLVFKDFYTGALLGEKIQHTIKNWKLRQRLRAAEVRETYLNTRDPLTGLENQSLFQQRVTESIQQCERYQQHLAVLVLDIDRFKTLNNSLGFQAGDQLLQQVAKRLKSTVRDTDPVARLGGDDFALCLSGIDKAHDVAQLAESLLATVAQGIKIENMEYFVSSNIGIALYPGDGRDAGTLISHAGTAMQNARSEGRNQYHFYTVQMRNNAKARLAMETEIRRAIEESQFRVHYQPQIDTQTGEVVAVEALVRWQHPRLGLISPHDFIPLSEDTGLILHLGNWVLKEACQQNSKWQAAGLPKFRMAVNLSALQFEQQDFVETVVQTLADAQLDPEWLELELTEGTLMSNTPNSIEKLHQLKAMGIRISIDDFGTGYS